MSEAIDLDPKSRVAHLVAARAYIAKRMFDAALLEAREAHTLTPTNTQPRALAIVANAILGAVNTANPHGVADTAAAFTRALRLSVQRCDRVSRPERHRRSDRMA
jgi:hypothetical protein